MGRIPLEREARGSRQAPLVPLTVSAYVHVASDGSVVGRVECVGLAAAYRMLSVRAGEFVRQAESNGEQMARREPAPRCLRCKRLFPKGDEFAHLTCRWRRG